MRWYCIHAAPRQENKVALLLQRDLTIEVFAPRIRFRRMRAGRPMWATEALFPGYLFARFDYLERRRQINALAGVTAIVHFGERAAPVDETIMSELRSLVGDNETVAVVADPQPGSEVVIAAGSLRGLRVLVTRLIPARQRIAILLDLLGSPREVEIERDRVLPMNPRQQN
jgi:transcriptional antiterminator RfaH